MCRAAALLLTLYAGFTWITVAVADMDCCKDIVLEKNRSSSVIAAEAAADSNSGGQRSVPSRGSIQQGTAESSTTPARALLATIRVLSGPSAGKELPITKPLTTLGKPGVQVAAISKRPNGWFIIHVGGNSFPVLNGKKLNAQAHPLKSHDVIEVAGVKVEFYVVQ